METKILRSIGSVGTDMDGAFESPESPEPVELLPEEPPSVPLDVAKVSLNFSTMKFTASVV